MSKSTMDALLGDVDHRLIHVLLDLLRDGPQYVEWLTARARSRLRDARVDHEAVISSIDQCTLMVGRPDGSVIRLLDLLEGQVLTHRVSHPLGGRADLWTNLATMPLLAWAGREPLLLTSGDVVTPAEFGHSALVGPPGWLPPAPPGHLIGFRITSGRLGVEAVDPAVLDLGKDRAVRQMLTTHYRAETWWAEDELAVRPGALNRAIGYGLLEQPDLFAEPVSPLNELLYDALREDERLHQFRDRSAWEAGENVTFGIAGMPEYLYLELSRRADKYGMSLDQYVILALGHLAWRTPFAEDLGPWEAWDLDAQDHESGNEPKGNNVTILPPPPQ